VRTTEDLIKADLGDPMLQYRERVIVAYLRTAAGWHSLPSLRKSLGIGKNMCDIALDLHRRGYLERKELNGSPLYRVSQ
jgi:hypothetical protein